MLTGMKVTLREFFTKKTTEQYPENRATLKMFDRFRGELVMPHDENNHHKCIACGTCKDECPVSAISEGDIYVIDADSCIDCGACAAACPSEAIVQK